MADQSAAASEQLLVEVVVDDQATAGLQDISKSVKEFGNTSDRAMTDARRQTERFNDSVTKFSRLGTRSIKTFDSAVTALLRKAPLAVAFDLGARVIGWDNAFQLINDTLAATSNSIVAAGQAIGNILVPSLVKGNTVAKDFDRTLAALANNADKRVLVPFGPTGKFDDTNQLQVDIGGLEKSSPAVEKIRKSVQNSAKDYETLTNQIGQAVAELTIFGSTKIDMSDISAELTRIGAGFEYFGDKSLQGEAAFTQALLTAKRLNKEVAGLVIETDNQIKQITGFTVKFDQLGRLQISPVFKVLAEDVNRAKQIVKEIDQLNFKEVMVTPTNVAVPLVELTSVGVSVKTVYATAKAEVKALEKEVESFKKKLEELKTAGGDKIGVTQVNTLETAIAKAEEKLAKLNKTQPAETWVATTEQSLGTLSFGLERARMEAELLHNPFDQLANDVNEIKYAGEQANMAYLNMFAQGQITAQQYKELIDLQGQVNKRNEEIARSSESWSFGMKQGMESIKVTAADLGNQAVTGSFQAFRGFFNDITDLSGGASEAFKNFARNFAANLADMGAQVLAFQLTSGLFSSLFPNFQGWTLAKGGMVQGGLEPVNSYAGGGIAKGEQFAKIGDNPARVEAVVPLPGANRGIPVEFKNGGGGGGMMMENHWNITSMDPRGVMEMIMQQQRVIEDMVTAAISSGTNKALLDAVRGA